MQRFLLAIIVLLAALLVSNEPRLARADEFYLSWLLRNTMPRAERVPLTVVEIGRDPLRIEESEKANSSSETFLRGTSSGVSPLEFALFLQSILDFKPTVLAIEPLLRWHERDKDQEQVFLDQAMRIPKLLLAAELTATPDPDMPPTEIMGFTHVSGRRGDLPTFTGISRQPDEDLRLISTLCYNNLPDDVANPIRVPLLFQYRSEVIPAFALQVFLTWARIPMSEVTIALGSHIALPQGRKIPIGNDGSILINPNAARLGYRLSLNELLLLVQQKPKGSPLETLNRDLLLARTPRNPLAPADVFAAAIASLQSNHYVRRISGLFDCAVLVLITFLGWMGMRASRADLMLGAIAFTAAYCLLGLGLVSRYEIWLPGLVPLLAICSLTILAFFWPRAPQPADTKIAA
jgi:hypothetical protein